MQTGTVARENATLRAEFLRRGIGSPDRFDSLGWPSHETLDLWESAGVLELGLAELPDMRELAEIDWKEFLHPRGRGGEWIQKLGDFKAEAAQKAPEVLPQGLISRHNRSARLKTKPPPTDTWDAGQIKRLKGRRLSALSGRTTTVYKTPGADPFAGRKADVEKGFEYKPERMGFEQLHQEATAAEAVHEAGIVRLARMERAERRQAHVATLRRQHAEAHDHTARADALRAARFDRKQTFAHGQAELYERRSKRLERRIRRRERRAGLEQTTPAAGAVTRGPNDLSAAEIDFNDAGKVSARTLLAYAESATSSPTTAEMYRDAEGNYHPSRQQLHEDIINMMLRQHEWSQGDHKDLGLSKTADSLKPPDGPPSVILIGGGYAAGKGGLVDKLRRDGQIDDNWLWLDPDLIKAELPEFKASAMDDPEANLRVYQEAWDISQELMKRAQEKGLNVVVDGLADTDADEVRSNTFTLEWPPRSGRTQEFPEIDRAGWFSLREARERILPAQAPLLDRLAERTESA